jgi:hypothetical protein
MWYCVHALHVFEYLDGKQDDYLIWEHLYLIQASSPKDANRKGNARAHQDESRPDQGLMRNDRPARLRFAKIYKVVDCQDLDANNNPTDGTELSYSEYLLSNEAEFEKLLANEPAKLEYLG